MESLLLTGAGKKPARVDRDESPMQRVVQVWGKACTIDVEQNSKASWTAVGEYMGERHAVKGRTANDAASQWQVWAKTKGG